MRAGRQKPQLTISDMERAQLSVIARSRSMPAALVLRAKIVLACECEANNQAVAANLNLSPYTVGKWRAAASSQTACRGFTTRCGRAGRGRSRTRPWSR
jgi:hypothetical protein